MITKWKVSNFKSIQEETELELGPLTIFAGANSSGKSTFIQSILLVAQTLANKVSSRSVVLNGALTSLGQFDDLKSNGSETDQIVIKCTCSPLYHPDNNTQRRLIGGRRRPLFYGFRSSQLKQVKCKISFDADTSSPDRDFYQIQPRLFSSSVSSVIRDEDNIDQTAKISVRYSNKALTGIDALDTADEIDDQLRSDLTYDVDLDSVSLDEVREEFRSANAIGCDFQHFLPERVVYSIDTMQEDANALTLALQNDAKHASLFRYRLGRDFLLSKEIISLLRERLVDIINFDDIFMDDSQKNQLLEPDSMSLRIWNERLRSLPRENRILVQQELREQDDLFDEILDAMKTSNPSATDTHSFVKPTPPKQIREAVWYLGDFFSSSLKYLGPLRDAPKPLYPLAPEAGPYDVGLRGEHTASILDLHKNKKINYIPSAHFKEPTVSRKTVTRTLEAAVIDWLQYLGVASSVSSSDKGKLGHELKVSLVNSNDTHDLTHVGVGVSQVLPILVMCLLADTDSTLVFEQPELHLHPKVQTLLGDFFLSMALCSKQCIVETHSEYFIDRLRFRIAAATPDNELNSKAKIYFVEKPSQTSDFREVVVNEYGAISDWPEGFFDQSQQQAEEILRAAAMKRKASRSKKDG